MHTILTILDSRKMGQPGALEHAERLSGHGHGRHGRLRCELGSIVLFTLCLCFVVTDCVN